MLMYLPEEPAFQVLTRLMGPGGPDLRNLYLPGLEGLKQLLRCYEWLMERLMPSVKEHLEVGFFDSLAENQNNLFEWNVKSLCLAADSKESIFVQYVQLTAGEHTNVWQHPVHRSHSVNFPRAAYTREGLCSSLSSV